MGTLQDIFVKVAEIFLGVSVFWSGKKLPGIA